MNENLAISLELAETILLTKKDELKKTLEIIQETPELADELVILFAEICDVNRQAIKRLERVIALLNEQISIFGKIGLSKDLEIVPKEDYPDDQQPEKI